MLGKNPLGPQTNLIRFKGEKRMVVVILTAVLAATLLAAVLVKRTRNQHETELHSITPEDLHALLASNHSVLLFDVRQPLDLLGDSVIIPGARWLAPQEILENPSLIPRERDLVVYCTCPSAKTSRAILRRALAMGFLRIKFLKGGLNGWRASGFPVVRYLKPFHLHSSGGIYSGIRS
jgi:rhodanese-related sulfurtransferase